jgi:hypothetical protein
MFHCCVPERLETTVMETLNTLDLNYESLDVQIAALNYQMIMHTKSAKEFKEHGDLEKCKQELRRKHEKSLKKLQYIKLQDNIDNVRQKLQDAETFSEITDCLGNASKTLEDTLKKLDPDRIDGIMDNLQDTMGVVSEVGASLSVPLGVFDEEAALNELEEPLLPERPVSVQNEPREQKRIAIAN